MKGRARKGLGVFSWAGLVLATFTLVSAKTPPAIEIIKLGSYRVEIARARNWEIVTQADKGLVVFQYTDKPALTEVATIALRRIVVPVEARSGDRAALAAAFVTNDVAGAQPAIFGSNAQLVRMSRKTQRINGGELFRFGEEKDAIGIRLSSSKFLRGWIFFPKTYDADGVIFLLLGKQETGTNEVRPEELDRAEEIVAGIREH